MGPFVAGVGSRRRFAAHQRCFTAVSRTIRECPLVTVWTTDVRSSRLVVFVTARVASIVEGSPDAPLRMGMHRHG